MLSIVVLSTAKVPTDKFTRRSMRESLANGLSVPLPSLFNFIAIEAVAIDENLLMTSY